MATVLTQVVATPATVLERAVAVSAPLAQRVRRGPRDRRWWLRRDRPSARRDEPQLANDKSQFGSLLAKARMKAARAEEARSVAGTSDGRLFRAGELCKVRFAARLTQLVRLLIQAGIKTCRSEKTCAVAGVTDRGSFGRRELAEELISALGTRTVGKQDDQHEEREPPAARSTRSHVRPVG